MSEQIKYEEFVIALKYLNKDSLINNIDLKCFKVKKPLGLKDKEFPEVEILDEIKKYIENDDDKNFNYKVLTHVTLDMNTPTVDKFSYYKQFDIDHYIQFESSLSIEAVRSLIEREELDKLTKNETFQNKKHNRL